jgi:asparagine synthase (glutamine-hydrolysing)
MCGIAVAIDWDDAEAVVSRMIAAMAHRGDIDDPVVAPAKTTAMATRRLRIVDAEHGVQPQFSADSRFLVSFNGEIYNHQALRRELEGLGIQFHTRSDTEVLANALRVWGAGALPRLVGMYAFVAYDLKTGEFLAARDPLGVKPLYLIQSEGGFLFASEIRPLLDASETGEVLLLPPGHALTRTVFKPFARLGPEPGAPLMADDPATLDRILDEAVRIRIPPDLPFATFMSGGVDSTLIAHYAARYRPAAPGYFLGGADAPDYAYAARFAERSGYDLRLAPLPEDTTGLIGAVVSTVESFEPSVVRDALCGYLLSQAASRDGFRVALCGEGADELFAGYAPMEAAYAEGPAFGDPVRAELLAGMHRSNLQRVDRCGMRFGLEVREPFLDPAVIAYALGLDPTALVSEASGQPVGKQPLRRLFQLHPERLPREIAERTKLPMHRGSGFDVSQAEAPWGRHAEATISDRDFADGQRQFAAYDLRRKEELLYLRALSQTLDLARVPHLAARERLNFPTLKRMERVAEYMV